jgi:hypothetical protein
MRYVSDKYYRENYNTQFIFSDYLLENYAVYEIIWKSIIELDWPQMTI